MKMNTPRIDLIDSMPSVIKKMADGNPGAISTMVAILQGQEEIDPQNAMRGLGVILSLDTYQIYGTDIYILYSDKCGKDLRKMFMILRATQLGFFSSEKLKEMAHDQMRQVNLTDEEWTKLDKQVCDRLDKFAKPEKDNGNTN